MLLKFDRYKNIAIISRQLGLWAAKRLRPEYFRGYYIYAEGDHDDQSIKDAIEDLPKNPGGQLSLSEGIFDIRSSIAVTESRVNIVGVGMDATELKAGEDLSDYLLKYQGADAVGGLIRRFKLADLCLSGNERAYAATDGLLLYCGFSMYMANVRIEEFKGYGLRIRGWYDSTFLMPEIISCGDDTGGALSPSLHIFNAASEWGITGMTFLGGAIEYPYWKEVLIAGDTSGGRIVKRCNFFGTKFAGTTPAAPYDLVTFDDAWEIGLYDCNFAAHDPGGGSNLRALVLTGGSQGIKVIGSVFYGSANADGIDLVDADDCSIDLNRFSNYAYTPYDIRVAAGCVGNFIGRGNQPLDGLTVVDAGTGTVYVTQKSGTDTIASGQTTKAVTHGLATTPTIINISFREPGTADYGRWWLSAIGATTFTLNVSVDPGVDNLDFGWEAKVR